MSGCPTGWTPTAKGRRGIRLYAQSRELIAAAETIAADVLSSQGLRCTLELTRWNPADEQWQSPLLPVEPPRGPLPDAWSGLDEAAWEVRLRFPHGWEAAQLHTKLLARDAAVICNGKRLTIGIADERTARQRAGELRLAAPTATIEVRPSRAGGSGYCASSSSATTPPAIFRAVGAATGVAGTAAANGTGARPARCRA